MVDDRPEDTGSLPDSSRPKREPPTIELEATEISSETKSAAAASSEATPEPVAEPTPEAAKASVEETPVAATPSRPVSPWIVAPVSGAVAAALVIGVGWMLGWPAIQPASAPPAPQLSAAIDGLTARVAGLEPKVGKPVPDPAAKLDEYIAHRLDRERRLVNVLDRGVRAEADLLDEVWDDAPAVLRPAAAVTLRAHLDKLREEGRLPPGAGEPRS